MPALFESVFNQIGPAGFEGLTQGILRGTLGLVIAGSIALALHKRVSPATRHMIWTIGVTILLLVPLGMVAAPAMRILPDWSEPMRVEIVKTVVPPGPHFVPYKEYGYQSWTAPADDLGRSSSWAPSSGPAFSITHEERDVAPALSHVPSYAPPREIAPPAPQAPQAAAPIGERVSGPAFPWGGFLFATWLVGFLLCIAPVMVGFITMFITRLKHRHVSDGPWHDLLQSLRKQLGIRRPVSLIRSKAGAMPMTWGFFLPQVVLPEDSFGWTAERKRVVLLHELAHVRRWDTLTQLLAQVACALFWFNPLVWYAGSRMRIERELACDDLVLRAGCRPSDYAEELLGIAVGRGYSGMTGSLGVPMARASKIQSRIRSILDLGRRPGAITRLGLFTGVIAAAAVLVPALMLRAKSSIPAQDPLAWASNLLNSPNTLPANPKAPEKAIASSIARKEIPLPPSPASASELAAREELVPTAESAGGPAETPSPLPAQPDPALIAVIQKRLDTRFPNIDILNQPLDATLQKLADDAKVKLDIDWNMLAQAGIVNNTPMRYVGQNVTCGEVIQSLLIQATPANLSSNRPVLVVREHSAWIAPRYSALADTATQTYRLKSLLAAKDDKGQPLWTPKTLLDRIKQSGEPGDWDHPEFTNASFVDTVLTVRAPQATHAQIRRIIAEETVETRPLQPKSPLSRNISHQPINDAFDKDPAKTLVLNNAGSWNEVVWLYNAMAVSARKFKESANDVWRFTITDPKARQVWYRHITSPVIADRYPYLVVRYRATGLASSAPYMFWMDDGLGPNMGGFAPLGTSNMIADGVVREIKVDLRTIPRTKSNTPGPLAGSLAIGVSNAAGKRADFDLIQIRLEADPNSPNKPVALDQTGAFKIVDEDGQPIQGATVQAMADWQNLSTTGITDSDGLTRVWFGRPTTIGRYNRPDRPEPSDAMVVHVVKDGYWSRMFRIGFPLPPEFVLKLDPIGQAKGSVVDEDHKPVADLGVMVEVHNRKTNQSTERSAITDAQGHWITDDMPVGKDWHVGAVRALDTRYLNKEHLTQSQIGKLSAKDLCTQETNISVQRGVTLSGRVLDQDGKGVGGCAIDCTFKSGLIEVSLDITADSSGRYTIPNVAAGHVKLIFRGGGHQPMNQSLQIASDTTSQTYNAILTKATPIRGRLVDRYGQPIKGVWVRTSASRNSSASYDGMTDANGNFTYPNAPDKPCFLELVMEEGHPYYMVEIAPDSRLQTIHLYGDKAIIDPLCPLAPNNTAFPIRRLSPAAAMRVGVLEMVGLKNIRPKV